MLSLSTDVAIVGAGPGGLTAAHALQAAAPHLKVMVFEKSAANLLTTRRGAGLGLDVNGQKALKAIKPELHTSMLEMASFLRTGKVLRPDGTQVTEVPQSVGIREHYAKQGFRTPCLFGWSDMQRLLAKALPESVPISTGMEFDHYELAQDAGEGDHITAYFKPTSSSTTLPSSGGSTFSRTEPIPLVAVKAQLLVASDGYFSRVRKQCLADGPPQWDGTLLWRARLPHEDAAAVGFDLVDGSVYVQDVGRFLFTYPTSSGDMVWTVGCHDEKLAEMGLDTAAIQQQLASGSLTSKAAAGGGGGNGGGNGGADYTQLQTHGYCLQEVAAGQAAKARCLQAMAGLSKDVLELINVTPASSLVEHGVYIRPAASISADSFGRGRVFIMGDAAHPQRPTGQGFNQAVEDAYGLGKALAGCSSAGAINLNTLQDLRVARARRIKPIVAFSTETGRAAYDVLKQAADEEEAAIMSMGWGTEEMSNEQFEHYVYDLDYHPLGGAASIAGAAARLGAPRLP